MEIKSRFALKRGVLLNLKISEFGWKKVFCSPQIREKGYYSSLGTSVSYVLVGGIGSAVFKSGKHNIVDNFKGITIPPIMEKYLEAAIHKCVVFVDEGFQYDNGFLEGNRTSENIFILNGLVERQLTMICVCFIDFSKAFDMINQTILSYKLIKKNG